MKFTESPAWQVLKQTASNFLADDCLSMAASLAYFSVFSLPGVLVIVITVAGAVFGEEAARGEVRSQTEMMLGAQASQQLEDMVEAANKSTREMSLAAVIGIVSLVIGATGVFGQLQNSLNKVWRVAPDPKHGGIRGFITKRVLSFSMVAGLGFLLLISLTVSAAIAMLSDAVGGYMGEGYGAMLLEVLHVAVSLVVFAGLFAALFKIMPDVELAWRDVFVGACVTSLVFAFGKFAIGFYLGNSSVASTYGAAGSLVVVLIWVYYSSAMLLAGAEYTHALYKLRGNETRPEPGAVAVGDVVTSVRSVPSRS